MFGIKNYQTIFYSTVEDFKKNNTDKLKQLIGKKIKESWIIWEQNNNEWYSDGVVIINCMIEMK